MKPLALVAAALLATAAWGEDTPAEVAQEDNAHPTKLRDLCSERPGLNLPACTVDPGHLQVELGLGDWTLDRQADRRADTIEAGEILLRYGVSGTTELRVEWQAFGHVRTRDRASGTIETASGIGDITFGVKQNLAHPAEGKTGLGLALLPYVTAPTGHSQVGGGDWATGLFVPTSYKLNDTVQFELTPEIDAAANESGDGRHLRYGTAFGVQVHLTEVMRLTPEIEFLRDRDPEVHATEARAALSFDVQPQKMTQLDVQGTAGLNHATPDVELSFGVTRKF